MTRTENDASEDVTTAPDGRPMDEQPRWRHDFPIDAAADEYVSRRGLIKLMTLTSLAFVGGHIWLVAGGGRSRYPALPRVAIAKVDDLVAGGATIFQYPAGSPPRLLVRLDEERFVAYDQACTHLSCPVTPKPENGKLHCPCHNGWFDLTTGAAIAGPPRRPLPRVDLEIEDGVVYAVALAPGAS